MRASRWLVIALALALTASSAAAQEGTPGTSAGPYHLAATWTPPGEGGWDYLTVDADARRLYLARQDRVQVLNADTGELVGEIGGLDGAHGIALAPALGRGFATSGKSGTVVVFDLATLKPVGAPIAVGKKPDAIAFEAATGRVFAFNGDSEDATAIDAAEAKVVGRVPLGGGPEFAAADGQGEIFVNLEDKSELLAIDAKSLQVLHRWPLAPGESPSGLSIDAAGRRLFSGCHNEKMMVINADTGSVVAALPIGQGVDATAFDPGTKLAFSSNGDGTLTIVTCDAAGSAPRVLVNLPTRRSARTMAVDAKTHAVYLPAASFAAVPPGAPPHTRPKMIPGSFVILKYDYQP